MSTQYYGVTPVGGDLLLTGEKQSFWARRSEDGGIVLGPPTGPRGNLWQGCVMDDRVWLTKRGHTCWGAADGGFGCDEANGPAETGAELDYTDVICSPDAGSIFLGQLVRGGLLEVDTRAKAERFHPVMTGFNLQAVPGRDGRIVGITTSRLFVFDPKGDAVLDEQPAGIVAMGVDVCAADDAVAVTDFTGRLRLFQRSGEGYALLAGVQLPAPRRVAFSPACDRIIVTSGDDRHVYLVRRSDLVVMREYRLGPGLRDVTFLDDKTAAAVDACTINLLDASP
jgi:hypothetical protein